MPAVSEVRSSRPPLSHRIVRMSGRDPHERHRAATPLELLFDLTFVVAFGEAGNQMAHLLAEGHLVPAIVGFVFAMFAACWAWINYSWFASAYDTDDWYFRIATMVVMVGVLILALGLPAMFHSIDAGHDLDNGVMVAGYVVMRVAMIGLWLRAARQDPARRSTCLTYVLWVSVAQIGWIALIIVSLPLVPTLLAALTLGIIEMTGPYLTERRKVETPWHAHHIAERYGLLVIIALGEGIIGTIASLSAVIDGQGWSLEAISVAVAGTGLTFGMWWVYFTMPSGKVLHRYRERGFAWGYWHLPLFMSIAATGAGLHVAAYVVEDEAQLGVPGRAAHRGRPGGLLPGVPVPALLAPAARLRSVPRAALRRLAARAGRIGGGRVRRRFARPLACSSACSRRSWSSWATRRSGTVTSSGCWSRSWL